MLLVSFRSFSMKDVLRASVRWEKKVCSAVIFIKQEILTEQFKEIKALNLILTKDFKIRE